MCSTERLVVSCAEIVASQCACDKKKCCSGKFLWFVTGLKTVPGTDTEVEGEIGWLDTYSPKCQLSRVVYIP